MSIETRGTEWLEERKEDVVECSLRKAKFLRKYCYYLQKKVPDKGIDEMGSFNDGLSRAMNICRGCDKYLKQLDTSRFLNGGDDGYNKATKGPKTWKLPRNTNRRRKSEQLESYGDDGRIIRDVREEYN